MTAAHLLSRQHEVHLFESANRLGGHTATKEISVASGKYAIDTGFIVFNDWTYPNFIRLMDQLGVKSKASEMSFAVSISPRFAKFRVTISNISPSWIEIVT